MVAIIGRKIPTTGVEGAQAGGLGNVFDKFASVLADPLTPELKRQKLLELNQGVLGRQMQADTLEAMRPTGTLDAINFYKGGVLSGAPNVSVPLGVYSLVHGAGSQQAADAAVGAGHPYQGTAPGMQAQLANNLAQIKAKADSEFVPVSGPNGVSVYGRAGESVGQPIPPSAQAIKNVSFWDPNTRNVYQSQDGGQTVFVGANRVPVAGSGLQPVSFEQAVAQTQDTMTQRSMGALPPASGQPSRAALAAEMTSGPTAPIKHEINTLAGLIGAGEAFPQTNEARNYLTNLVNTTRNTLAAAPGRVSVQAQQWAAEPFPQPGWFGMTGINAEEQKNNVYRTVSHLREVYDTVRQEASDPSLPPQERQKYAAYLHGLANTIRMWEAPANAPQTAGAPAPQAPAVPAAGGAQAAPTQPERWERVNGVLQRVQ